MDFTMGLRGADFVLLCSDTSAVNQIIAIKDDEEKLVEVDKHKLFALSGTPGDRVQFSEFIIANIKLYSLRNSKNLDTKAVANFTRKQLATALRKRPYQVNLLLGGFDEHDGASLYWTDYLGTQHQMNVAGSGYGSYFVLSMFDRLWRPDITREEGLEMMKKGIEEVKKRLVVAPPKYAVKMVDKRGITDMGMF